VTYEAFFPSWEAAAGFFSLLLAEKLLLPSTDPFPWMSAPPFSSAYVPLGLVMRE